MTPAAMSVEDEALWRWITATKQKLLAEEEKMARENGDNRRGRRQRTAWDADGDYHPIPEVNAAERREGVGGGAL